MHEVRDAMIVAGGAGTRLWPLTATRPKPLVGFCGAPFLEGVLGRLAAAGVDRVFLVVGADPEPFRILDDAARTLGVRLEAVPEPEPLDTAGGVRSVVDRVRGSFLVLNGDILTDVDLRAVLATHRAAAAAASLVLTRVSDTSTFGVCVLEGTRIVDFVEKPPAGSLPDQDAVNAGTYVLEPDALRRFPLGRLSFERDVFPTLAAEGEHLEGIVSDALWADLGTPARYLAGHRAALAGEVAWPVLDDLPADEAGVRRAGDVLVSPHARLVGPVLLASGTVVEAGAEVGPDVVLAAGTRVAVGARIRDSVLGPANRVGPGAQLTSVVTGEGVRIGADARLTAGVVLGDHVVVPAGAELTREERIPPM